MPITLRHLLRLFSIRRHRLSALGVFAVFCLFSTLPLVGQISGTLAGTVVDATGAAVVGAKVTATRTDSGRQTVVMTNGSGSYVFTSLSPAIYNVTVTAPGFQTFLETNVILAANQSLTIDAKLRIGATTETVQVQANADGSYAALDSSSATRTNTPLIDVPQSVETLTHNLLVEQDARTLADALVNVSGVTPTKPEEVLFTPIIIRGFPAEIYVDGLPTYGGTGAPADPTSLVGIERIDVLKGPTATLYGGGIGTPLGGLINIVSERPESKAAGVFAFRGGSFGTYGPYADFTMPLGSKAAFRIAGEDQRNQSWIDLVHGDRWSAQPSFLFKLTPDDQLLVQGQYEHRSQLEYSGIPAVQAMAGQIDRNAFPGAPIGQPPTTINNRLGTIELRHRFSDDLHLVVSGRYYVDSTTEYGSFVDPQYDTNTYSSPTMYGVFPIYLPGSIKEATLDANLSANVHALGGRHELLGGIDYDHINFQGDLGFVNFFDPIGTIDLAHPVYNIPFGPIPPINDTQTDRYETVAGYVQDQATYGRLHLTGSLRYTQLEFREREESIDQTYKHVSPRIGANVDVAHGVVLYAGYSTAFRASFAYFGLTPPKPESSRNAEGGVKLALLKAHLSGTVAVFYQTHDNVPTADPDPTLAAEGYSVQVGQQRAEGAEADLLWEPVHALSVLANYAYTEAAVTQSDVNGIPVGNILTRIPRDSARLAAHYRVPNGAAKGLSFGAGITGFSSRQDTLPNTVSTPGYAMLDAQASYDFGRHYTIEGSAINLANRKIFDPYEYLGIPLVIPNQPLSAYGTLKVHF